MELGTNDLHIFQLSLLPAPSSSLAAAKPDPEWFYVNVPAYPKYLVN